MSAAGCHGRQTNKPANSAKCCAPMNLNMLSHEFLHAPCPCKKCKERAREQKEARIKAVGNNPNGMCGMPLGTQPPQSGQGCASEAGRQPMISSKTAMCQGCNARGPAMGPEGGLASARQSVRSGGGPAIGPEGGPASARPSIRSGGGPAMGPSRESTLEANTQKQQRVGAKFDPTVNFGRKSSLNENIQSVESGVFGPQNPKIGARYGRDTFGVVLNLGGKQGVLDNDNRGNCDKHVDCDEHCGLDTECSVFCKIKNVLVASGSGSKLSSVLRNDSIDSAVGYSICSNEFINMFVNCSLEIVGILIFFAICTIVFWIKLGYHIVQLVTYIINADRGIKVAIGVVLALLLLAFAISLTTNPCCSKQGSAIQGNIQAAVTSNNKSKNASPKNIHPNKQSKLSIKDRLKVWLPWWFGKRTKGKPASSKAPRQYTDCQGRKIFDTSRRTAILTEMKQPPTWLIWLHDRFYRS